MSCRTFGQLVELFGDERNLPEEVEGAELGQDLGQNLWRQQSDKFLFISCGFLKMVTHNKGIGKKI
jgi:hypothetical protein